MRVVSLLVLVLLLSACETGDIRAREKGALGGTALGAGLGAIVGNQAGNPGAGIAIGAAAGALSGALIGNEFDNMDTAHAERERRIEEQERMLSENRRLIEELRSRGADVRETDRGVVVNLPDVLFEFDSARLTHDARVTAGEIADVAQGVERRTIAVEGHTDSVGTLSYNQRLSEERARSVADELVARGVSRRRVMIRGYGETDPIASNRTDAGRQRNRRVEVIIEN